ncbi:hypothetical protein LR032_02545 [Candidatus Bipolaricaulota bacterium]|nr:hypothetical protein [Candidatus Bipolaricaulota bacterium]
MINKLKMGGALAALLLAVLLMGTGAAASEMMFVQTQYYLISIGMIATPIESLVQTAQQTGFTVIIRDGEILTAYRGKELTDEPEEVLLAAPSLLYVDGDRFLLRIIGEEFDYTVRPSADGYELVLVPHLDLPKWETLRLVIDTLQGMGLFEAEVEMQLPVPFEKDAERGPVPPEGVAIDSNLYWLTVSADWFAAASAKGITRIGLRVVVVAEKVPGEMIPEAFAPYIESETEKLARLLLPIERLVELARSGSIGYVRPPYRPHPAVP